MIEPIRCASGFVPRVQDRVFFDSLVSVMVIPPEVHTALRIFNLLQYVLFGFEEVSSQQYFQDVLF
jgi:hypothetical protein